MTLQPGLDAVVYKNQETNDVVIAFAGLDGDFFDLNWITSTDKTDADVMEAGKLSNQT